MRGSHLEDPRRRKERGVALIIVLSMIALLSAVVIGLESEVARNMAHIENAGTQAEAERMAEVGLAAAQILLQYDAEEDDRNKRAVDYYFQMSSEGEGGGFEALAALGQMSELWSLFRPGLPSDSSPLSMMGLPGNFLPLGDEGGVEIVIEDQSGKWNPHRLDWARGIEMKEPEVQNALNGFASIFEQPDVGRTVVAAMIDWMDADDEKVDPSGAETFHYKSLEPPYEARNGPFAHREEFRALRGVDEEVYNLMISHVTVWPNDLGGYAAYKINVNTATPETLTFLDHRLDLTQARRIVEARDREPFEKVGEIREFINKELGLKKVAGSLLDRDNVTVQSRAFLIRATGYTTDRVAVLEAVIDRHPTSREMRVISQRWLTLP